MKIKGPYIAIGKRRGGVGSYDWEGYFTSLNDSEQFDNGKVVFSFDDGFLDNYTAGLPLFSSKGVGFTVYLPTNMINDINGLTPVQLQEMVANDIDVQCHGDHSVLTTKTDGEIATIMTNTNAAFVAAGIPSPEHHCYSAGAFDDRCQNAILNYRKTGRSTMASFNTRKTSKLYLRATDITNSLATIKGLMDAALTGKYAMIMYGHHIGGVGISVADLTELIDYAQGIGIDIITINQLASLMFEIDLRASRVGSDTTIDLFFENTLPSGYRMCVERSLDGVTFSEIYITDVNARSYSDTGLTANTNYHYRVRAVGGGNYSPYSRVAISSTPISLTVSATGTGAGVATLQVSMDEDTLFTLDGVGRFYSDAAGTLNESTTWLCAHGSATNRYIRCSAGTVNMTLSKAKITQLNNWVASTNAPSIGGNIGKHIEIQRIYNLGNNTLSGDISKCKLVSYIYLTGTNTISGNISQLTSLTYLNVQSAGAVLTGDISNLVNLTLLWVNINGLSGSVANLVKLTTLNAAYNTGIGGSMAGLILLESCTVGGVNTLSGSIAALTKLTRLDLSGSNTVTGSLEALTLLTYLSLLGNNTVSGDMSKMCSNLTTVYLYPCAMTIYTAGGNWNKISSQGTVSIRPGVGYGYASDEVDLIINEIEATRVADRHLHIILTGSSAARTAASTGAVNAIIADGGAVTTN
jgi:peptidoglycan/xylan/chitin deacetylase (PgdA/CDA1 family)